MRSSAIGLSYTARYSGDFLNPLIVHPLGLALGLHTAFVVVGGLFLAGVVVAAVWRQLIQRARASVVRVVRHDSTWRLMH